MFGLFGKPRPRPASKPMRRATLMLEGLEARYCLTAPLALTLSAQACPGHMVMLSGSVLNSQPGGARVSFSGAAVGSVTTDWAGHFAFQTCNASLGDVSATATDQLSLLSNAVSASISVTAPTVTVSWTYGTSGDIVVSGQVCDIDPGGRTVTLSGPVSGTAVTNQDGSYSVHLRATGYGTPIQAVATDLWGMVSVPATTPFNPPAPVITDFTATMNTGYVWTFAGAVKGPEPGGLIIQLSGLPSLQD
ncbi:MAG TPA: hypothetical protein VGY58_03470, partial [Gemmataceae bacterium]|nr:hypothetical protein [Gemmataceae bacterium]